MPEGIISPTEALGITVNGDPEQISPASLSVIFGVGSTTTVSLKGFPVHPPTTCGVTLYITSCWILLSLINAVDVVPVKNS